VEGAVDAMEMHRVRVGGPVDEMDAEQVAFVGAEGRARYLPIEGPGREEHAGRDLDLVLATGEIPLPDHGAVPHRGHLAVVEH